MQNITRILFVISACGLLSACSQEPAEEPAATVEESPAIQAPDSSGVVDIIARDFAFDAPESIQSGWTTFRFTNAGAQTHFMLLYRLPDGKNLDDVMTEVGPGYDAVMAAIASGEADTERAIEMLGEMLPEWAFRYDFRGGVGMVRPGGVSETTVHLDEPGTYYMECYIMAPDGQFHGALGMIRAIEVTEEASDHMPPETGLTISLTNDGILLHGNPVAGANVFAVDYVDTPEGVLPFDVNLARLADDTDLDTVVHWMSWLNKGGFRAPSPIEFLGGAKSAPAGNTAYFTADLEPGRYLLISEVNPAAMQAEFTVE